ncbi:MAG: sulfatase family protein [Spirochaetota bacterium]
MPQKPNIIIMYADDLGFGDVGCYGAESVPTPNTDRLAADGLLFTDGYATAATCTPSRYSLLTGSYPWRNPNAAILAGDAPMIIGDSEETLASMLAAGGYRTGVVGKWHLGLGSGSLDWNGTIARTPNDVGFDESYILAATNDRVPCVYVHDRHVDGLDPDDPIEVVYGRPGAFPDVPTGREHPELLRMRYSHGHDGTIVNGVSRIGEMRGGAAALWDDEGMAEVFLERARGFVRRHADGPFFLYYAFHQPHVPRIPGPRFAGSTPHGPRGDVIAEMDWCVGELLRTLDELGIREETMVVFSSDNGPVLDDGYHDRAEELVGEHSPAGPLRGGKYSLYDGGTRVPFILSWPGTVDAGRSDALVSHVDFFASFAALVGSEVNADAAPDSENVLPALLGRASDGRKELVVEGMQAKTVLRSGRWTYIPPYDGPAVSPTTHTELGNDEEPQLYNLGDDIGQIANRARTQGEVVASMDARLREIRGSRRTRR